MIGHQQVIAARQAGGKPAAIFFELGLPAKQPQASGSHPATQSLHEAIYSPEAALDAGLLPTVYVRPDEAPDLRFCRGCQVHVSGQWSQSLIALGQALAEAGAAFVVVSGGDEDLMIFDGEWRTS